MAKVEELIRTCRTSRPAGGTDFFLEGTDLKDDEDELMARPGMHAHSAKFF